MHKKNNVLDLDNIAPLWKRYYHRNYYYHKNLQKLAKRLIPLHASVLEFGCREGELLSTLPNKEKAGVEWSRIFITNAKRKHKDMAFFYADYDSFSPKKTYDYILLSHSLSLTKDVELFARNLRKYTNRDSRVVVVFHNFLWKPFLDFGEKIHLRLPQIREANWLSEEDIENLFSLEGFEKISSSKEFLFPFFIPFFSPFLNTIISHLPVITNLCLTLHAVFRIRGITNRYSVSIVIPARNEAGNIPGLLSKIPKMHENTEVIFVEGHSKDDTFEKIKEEVKHYKGFIKTQVYKQKGKGKKDAVMLGFSKAKNQLLMIFDADLSTNPKELPKFYRVMTNGYADFAMGSRLVYPMEKQAMRTFNYFGNKFFSFLFSFVLGQKIKDTLCGTKVIRKKDFEYIRKYKYFGDVDPFGDFDLIFGAAKLNLKIIEIPIHYKERTYGTTNISRFQHGFLLLKMAGVAIKKFKFV